MKQFNGATSFVFRQEKVGNEKSLAVSPTGIQIRQDKILCPKSARYVNHHAAAVSFASNYSGPVSHLFKGL